MTINPISSANAHKISQPAERQPEPHPSKSNSVPQDKVTLGSVGAADHDADDR